MHKTTETYGTSVAYFGEDILQFISVTSQINLLKLVIHSNIIQNILRHFAVGASRLGKYHYWIAFDLLLDVLVLFRLRQSLQEDT
jgi:hypothetical protein